MPSQETQIVDDQARVMLPGLFAQTAVTVEIVSPSEVRIRKVGTHGDAASALPEEHVPVLSDRDRDRFLELISSPPLANAALRRAMAAHRKCDG